MMTNTDHWHRWYKKLKLASCISKGAISGDRCFWQFPLEVLPGGPTVRRHQCNSRNVVPTDIFDSLPWRATFGGHVMGGQSTAEIQDTFRFSPGDRIRQKIYVGGLWPPTMQTACSHVSVITYQRLLVEAPNSETFILNVSLNVAIGFCFHGGDWLISVKSD